MTHANSDTSEIDALRSELTQLRSEVAALRRDSASASRRGQRPRLRSIVAVGLLLAFASAGGIGYASVARVATPLTGSAPSAAYQAVTPHRILDTLNGTGAPKAAVAAMGTVSLAVAGVGGVPPDATAVVINVTVAQGAQAGNVAVYPDGTPAPFASNVNFLPGQTVPNLVVATVGGDGKVDFLNRSSGTVQLIADLAGYYAPGATNTLVVPSDGVAADNGAALESALASLSGTTPTLVQLEPGSYTVTAQLNVPANTSIAGAGRLLTTITSNAGLNRAVWFEGVSGTNAISALTLTTNANTGIVTTGTLLDVANLIINFATAASGAPAIAVNSPTTIDDSVVIASTPFSDGVLVEGGALVMQNSTISAVETAFGNVSTGSATIRNSVLDGGTSSLSINSGTNDVVTSQIGGPVSQPGGTLVCVGDYNSAYAAVGTACT